MLAIKSLHVRRLSDMRSRAEPSTGNVMALPPRLSVVIPHLNEPDDLRRCLHSLVAQKRDGISFEIIVVDNGSAKLPTEACTGVPDVHLEHETTPGPGPARNRGANLAHAGIIAFIDADCIACPGWVRSIVEYFEKNPETGFVGGDIGILPSDPTRLTAVEAYESIYSYRAQEYVERHGFAATGNMAVRTSVFRAVGPFGGIATMEDTEWGQRATALGLKSTYLPQAKVLTSSCKSFEQLSRRFDRHVAHEFRKVGGSSKAMVRWLLTGAAIAASPILEIVSITRSDRVSGLRARWLALVCMIRIRLYRARRMFSLALKDNSATLVGAWNRENP
jgi:cellulose synthase/poly-beta-1,6-N-acetylglucosamine synthase-like glycosyltransferase